MKKNQTSKRNGIEDFLCPFENLYITQGANGSYSHQGIKANDVRGIARGVREAYYAPCSSKCLKVYKSGGGSMWQSIAPVRFANGRVDFATYIIYHDNSQNCYVGQEIKQGTQIGNMGDKGQATGVHCHFEVSQSNDTTFKKNQYNVYSLNNEYDIEECCFMNDTNILSEDNKKWIDIEDIVVDENKPGEDIEKGDYRCLYDMYVRTQAHDKSAIKLVKQLTKNGQQNATSKNPESLAIYKKGTIFTALEIINNARGTWGRSPSGYICIKGASQKVYCEKKD